MTRTTDDQIAEWRKWIYRHHFANGNGNEPQGNGALSLLDIVIAERDRADELHKSLDFMRGRKDAAIRRENEWHRQSADADARIANVRELHAPRGVAPSGDDWDTEWCDECSSSCPCPTISALEAQ